MCHITYSGTPAEKFENPYPKPFTSTVVLRCNFLRHPVQAAIFILREVVTCGRTDGKHTMT
jgi:hypothetical protein